MELDELKKTWNLIDERLKDKQIVKDEDITRLISKAGNGINDLSRFLSCGILTALLIIAFPMALIWFNHAFSWMFIYLLIIILLALAWDLYTLRYLRNTRMNVLPLVSVIERINRFYRWSKWENVIGFLLIPLVAPVYYCFAIDLYFITPYILLGLFLTWGIPAGCIYWWYEKQVMKRLREIKKSLEDLKGLKDD